MTKGSTTLGQEKAKRKEEKGKSKKDEGNRFATKYLFQNFNKLVLDGDN